MKRNLLMLTLLIAGAAALSASQPARAHGGSLCDFMKDPVLALMTTTTGGPLAITSVADCVFHADLDPAMVQREATMVIEENKYYQPSYLGTYADKIGARSLQEAAQDVIENGVRE